MILIRFAHESSDYVSFDLKHDALRWCESKTKLRTSNPAVSTYTLISQKQVTIQVNDLEIPLNTCSVNTCEGQYVFSLLNNSASECRAVPAAETLSRGGSLGAGSCIFQLQQLPGNSVTRAAKENMRVCCSTLPGRFPKLTTNELKQLGI